MPPQPPPPRTFRERLGALRNLPPFLKLVWQTSPGIAIAQLEPGQLMRIAGVRAPGMPL